MEFSDLPAEIKCLIFSKFTYRQLGEIVAPVNPEWRHYARSPICWSNVDLINEKQTEQKMRIILKRCINVRRLKIRDVRNFHWFVDIPTRTSLLHLELFGCEISTDTISRLVTVFPNVEIFVLEHCNVTTDVITDYVIRWRNLKHITLRSKIIGDRNTCLDALAANCRNLTHFKAICFIDIDDRSFGNFLTQLSSQLKHLSISGLAEVTSNAYAMLGTCRKLKYLKLQARNFTDHDLLNLRVLNHLKCLKLQCSNVLFSSEFTNIFSGITFNPSVEDISITFCDKLNDKSLDAFIKSCPSNVTKLQIGGRLSTATHLACQDVGREHGFFTPRCCKGVGVIDFTR